MFYIYRDITEGLPTNLTAYILNSMDLNFLKNDHSKCNTSQQHTNNVSSEVKPL
jgi:hypothetical protein